MKADNYMYVSKLFCNALNKEYERLKPKWIIHLEKNGIKVNDEIWRKRLTFYK